MPNPVTARKPSDHGTLVARAIADVPFAVVDVETTGLYPDRGDRVCEVAIVHLRGGAEEASFRALVNPMRGLSEGARGISGIGEPELQSAASMERLAPELARRLRQRVLVAHNAPFVVGFLRAELLPLGFDLDGALAVDTLSLVRTLGLSAAHDLAEVAADLGLPPQPAHRALPDALTVADLLGRLVQHVGPRAPLSRLLPRPADSQLRSPDTFGDVRLHIEEAIDKQAELEICYYSPWRSKVTSRRVAPIALADDYYLEAFCRLRNAPRRFRIDRIRSVRVVGVPPSTSEATRATS